MGFTPTSPLTFVFKKYANIPTPVKVTVNVPIETYILTTTGKPNWLQIVNQSFNVTLGSFFFNLDQNSVNNLAPGSYSANISFTALSETHSPTNLGTYLVKLIVEDTVFLTATPSLLTYNYNIGDPAPTTKLLQIVSENNWSISADQTWVLLSSTIGSNSASISVSVNVSGLNAGLYQSIITINDGIFTRQTNVYLTVTEGDNLSNYLYLTPVNIEFLSEKLVANTTQKKINIDTANTWTATANQTWVVLSALSGVSGITDINISVNSTSLDVGVYQAEIVFMSNSIIKKTYITLRVIALSINGIESNMLYYADDRNKLTVSSVEDNTFLNLEMNTSNFEENINYQTSQPYFKGICNALIGVETNYLLKSKQPTNNLSTRIHNETKPININIAAYDVNLFTGAQKTVGNYTNLKFLKGRTPVVANKLSFIPENITISNKSIIQLSIISIINPGNAILTGAIETTILNSLPVDVYVYTLLLNLNDYELSHGDVFTVTFGTKTLVVTINNVYTELHTIAFENEWETYEFFETKGKFTKDLETGKTIFNKSIEGQAHTRVIEAIEEPGFTLNTGYIQSQEEIEWFSKILKAKRIFIYENNVPTEVILETNKLTIYKTREYLNSYNLNFKKAII